MAEGPLPREPSSAEFAAHLNELDRAATPRPSFPLPLPPKQQPPASTQQRRSVPTDFGPFSLESPYAHYDTFEPENTKRDCANLLRGIEQEQSWLSARIAALEQGQAQLGYWRNEDNMQLAGLVAAINTFVRRQNEEALPTKQASSSPVANHSSSGSPVACVPQEQGDSEPTTTSPCSHNDQPEAGSDTAAEPCGSPNLPSPLYAP